MFCHAIGEPLDPSYQTAIFKKAVEAAGCRRSAFTTCATRRRRSCLSKGVHVKLVSEMLGHATIVLTLDTYSHLIPAMHGDAAAAMDAVFTA